MKKRNTAIILAALIIIIAIVFANRGNSGSETGADIGLPAPLPLPTTGSPVSDEPSYNKDIYYTERPNIGGESEGDEGGEALYEPYPAPELTVWDSPQGTMADMAAQGWTGGSAMRGDYYVEPYWQGSEEYSALNETGFKSVAREPLSTFAADVDTASYSNLRRLLNSGYSLEYLPEGAVRIEEMLNYFSYDFKKPQRGEPFGVTTEISACPWNPESELLMIGLKTEEIAFSEGPASNLVFLIDVSGSMNDNDKLPLLQQCFVMLTENLTAKDRVSIVTYAGAERIVLQGADGSQKKTIIGAINDLYAGGSTNGSAGISTAYALAEEYFIQGGNNRVILATDGDLNVGLTTERELEDLITKKKESGVFLSVLGFGTGNIKDNKMETLANKGNGNYAYIDSVREGKKVLVEEMGATLITVCKDVKLQVEFNPAVVKEYRLIGYENRQMDWQDFRDDKKDGGEIGAGHSVTALYEIVLNQPLSAIPGLRYSGAHEGNDNNKAFSEEWLTISIRYKKPAGVASSELNYPIGIASYKANPSEDWRFAAAVAEFGLVAGGSSYQGRASLGNVQAVLRGLNLRDEYKAEFYELVSRI
jgi:Ca-activated chloride channel family protein